MSGIRGCNGLTKRRGKLRLCAQKAIVWRGDAQTGYCYYHDPERPRIFGGYEWPGYAEAQEQLRNEASHEEATNP